MKKLILFAMMLGIVLVVFFVLRGMMLWYYKINERIYLLERNNELLSKLLKHFTNEDSDELHKKKVKKGLFVNKEE